MIEKIKERWHAEETVIGNFLKKWLAGFMIICSALGAANEYLTVLPPDFVPTWVKTLVVISGVISFVAGKMTKK